MFDADMTQIPLIRLIPEPADDAGRKALGFKYAGDEIGKRHQLGGTPTWIQDKNVPDCPQCHEAMTFYGQLDSIGDRYVIGDCGMIYVFFCFNCNYAESKVQSF
ncbi:MAG: hypothetical protein ABL962_20135 [Fimbriimonadaceae bacterium]